MINLKKMKIIANMSLLVATLLYGNYALAQGHSKETLYHCPSLGDIKFVRSQYVANTKYNGHAIYWFDHEFTPLESKIESFTKARVNCRESYCIVKCDYKLANDDDIELEMPYGDVVTKISGGNWDAGKTCSSAPEQCQFYVSKLTG